MEFEFNLKEQNEILAEENKQLRNLLFNAQKKEDSIYVDSSFAEGHYKVITAEVYKNSYALTDNYLTINKGKSDSVKQDFGVISSKGIIGIIDNTSNSYATVLSILNTNSRINAKIKASNHLGTLEWNGLSPHIAQLVDVSKQMQNFVSKQMQNFFLHLKMLSAKCQTFFQASICFHFHSFGDQCLFSFIFLLLIHFQMTCKLVRSSG